MEKKPNNFHKALHYSDKGKTEIVILKLLFLKIHFEKPPLETYLTSPLRVAEVFLSLGEK